MTKSKLYVVILMACFTGFLYLLFSINYSESSNFKLCIIKNLTHYPCPSCGTTRAVKMLLKGDFIGSLQMNPFGIIVTVLMTVLPIWIVFDLATHKETFFKNYQKTESILRTRWIALFLIVLVILNWIWNIKKGL